MSNVKPVLILIYLILNILKILLIKAQLEQVIIV